MLDGLPDCFDQLSLTGGEPTLSPYFLEVLDVVRSRRNKYKKVVLTTNGQKILDFKKEIKQTVDHINLSRHHWTEKKNAEVFKTKNVPGFKKLKEISRVFKKNFTAYLSPTF